jgi:hypothetical protein
VGDGLAEHLAEILGSEIGQVNEEREVALFGTVVGQPCINDLDRTFGGKAAT